MKVSLTIWEKRSVGTAKDGKSIYLSPDAPVDVRIEMLPSRLDAVTDDAWLEFLGHGHHVFLGHDSQPDLVTSGLQDAGEMQDALRLIVNLLDDEKNTQCLPS